MHDKLISLSSKIRKPGKITLSITAYSINWQKTTNTLFTSWSYNFFPCISLMKNKSLKYVQPTESYLHMIDKVNLNCISSLLGQI